MSETPNDHNGTASINRPTMKAAIAPPEDKDFFLQPWPARMVARRRGIAGKLGMLSRCQAASSKAIVTVGESKAQFDLKYYYQIKSRHKWSMCLLKPKLQIPPKCNPFDGWSSSGPRVQKYKCQVEHGRVLSFLTTTIDEQQFDESGNELIAGDALHARL